MMTPSAPPALAALLPPVLFALAATLTPGGGAMLATASGARFGLHRSWPLILGIAAGVGLLWTNPKAWAMTLGAAASFGVLSQDPVRLAGLMGGAFAVAALFSLMIWCCAGWMLARLLRASWQWRMLNLALSLLLLVSVGAIWRHT